MLLSNSGKAPFVQLVFPSSSISNSFVQHRGCDFESLFAPLRTDIKLCTSFSNHGHCISGRKCPLSHDIDLIVLHKEANIARNERKRRRSTLNSDENSVKKDKSKIHTSSEESNGNMSSTEERATTSSSDKDEISSPTPPTKSSSKGLCGGHRAGFDAFMTGFSFATFVVHSTLINPEEGKQSEAISRLLGVPTRPEFTDLNIVNRIYLVCKDIPFMVRKSAFSRNSIGHSEKYTLLNK